MDARPMEIQHAVPIHGAYRLIRRIQLRAGTFSLGLAGLVLLATPPGAAAGSLRVALLPIVVHSAEADTGYLSQGLGDMLASRIESTPGVSVVRPGEDATGTTDRDAAIVAGRSLGAAYVVYGSFTQFGTGASLDVRCTPVETSGDDDTQPRQIFVQTGSVGEIIPKLDDLAAKVGRYVRKDKGGAGAPGAASAATAKGAAAPGDGAGELEDLRARIERLEKALYDPNETIGDSGIPVRPGAAAPDKTDTVAGDGGP
jgi:TolB-like protein